MALALLAVFIPIAMLGAVLALDRYEELMLGFVEAAGTAARKEPRERDRAGTTIAGGTDGADRT